ncbi:hypothetical protein, partial [Pseudomonas fluorescens]|uniref:hypothetical protein n=1 Tax=Pseudomonas fluorescens TaxID=294 RepID=UPI001CD2152D
RAAKRPLSKHHRIDFNTPYRIRSAMPKYHICKGLIPLSISTPPRPYRNHSNICQKLARNKDKSLNSFNILQLATLLLTNPQPKSAEDRANALFP